MGGLIRGWPDGKLKVYVCALAWQFYRQNPSCQRIYSVQDFIQEGMLVAIECQVDFEGRDNSSFETFCYRCIKNRFLDMVSPFNHNRQMDPKLYVDLEDLDLFAYNSVTPERQAMVSQAIRYLEITAEDLASVITDGVPDDLFSFAKLELREKAKQYHWDVVSSKVRFTKKLIMEYFGISKGELMRLAQSMAKFV